MTIETGGNAFPIQEQRFPDGILNIESSPGMTLRDYFAAKVIEQCCKKCDSIEFAAKIAYRIADAMLEARK